MKNKSKTIIYTLPVLLILTSCTTPSIFINSEQHSTQISSKKVVSTILSEEEISQMDKEYGFNIKAELSNSPGLSTKYVERKMDKLVGNDNGQANGTKIVKELEYARVKGESKIPVQQTFEQNPELFDKVKNVSAVQNAITGPNANTQLSTFVKETVSPNPTPLGLSTTSITSTSFIANWSAITKTGISYQLVIDNGTPINISTTSYNVTDLLAGSTHTWKIRSKVPSGASFVYGDYSAEQTVTTVGTIPSNVILVDYRATSGSKNGTSWANAYTSLQSALQNVNTTSGKEIWVASGTYKPTTDTDSSKTFTLKNGVAIYGGFAGTEISRSQRNWNTNVTILSGDLSNNDTAMTYGTSFHSSVPPSRTENTRKIITGTSGATIDGFTVTGGNALSSNDVGAGIYNNNSSPTISNMIFKDNLTAYGGAGIYNSGTSSPTITNVVLEHNYSLYSGAIMHSGVTGSPTYNNILFINNYGREDTSGIRFQDSSGLSTLNNVLFVNNIAGNTSPCFVMDRSNVNMNNVTIYANSAVNNGGVGAILGGPASSVRTFNMKNTIIFGNTAPVNPTFYFDANQSNQTTSITYSNIQGGYAGTGNINSDPQFVSTSDPDGADNIWMTADDGLRLQSGSPRNNGTNTGAPSTDITGLVRPKGIPSPITDMGAYEYNE